MEQMAAGIQELVEAVKDSAKRQPIAKKIVQKKLTVLNIYHEIFPTTFRLKQAISKKR
jgi:hypothetical protein